MYKGYAGSLLRVDLTAGLAQRQPLPPIMVDRFIGGRGFTAALLWNELPSGIDAFDPENMLIAATGPLSGHFMPASGKTHFGTKSPANGGYADSNMGGHFGPALKFAGMDALVLTGAARELSVLIIDDDKTDILPATQLAGQGALATEKILKEQLGDDFQIITIGPAGENRVRFACISHDFGRQAGRTGVGAVMGSKNLKAVAVRGTGSLPVHDLEGAYKKGRQAYAQVKAKPGFAGWTPEGTAGITDWVNLVGVFPTRNFQTSYAEFHKQINGKAILDHLLVTHKGCFCCPTPCGKYGKTKTGMGEAFVEGPEYESIALLGGNLVLKSIEEVAYANYVCDQLGLDTISAGVVISWVMECLEKGILTPEQVGRKVEFGDLESIVWLAEKIAAREGIGDLLADGVKTASEKTGQGSEAFAIHVKGLEWSGYECRNAPGMMLAYLTADIGAHHNRAWVLGHDMADGGGTVHDLIAAGGSGEKIGKSKVRGKSGKVIELQHLRPLFDNLGVCRLQYMELGYEVENYAELFHLITGRRLSWDELMAVSERTWHLTRAISVREIEGFGRSWDWPPERFYTEPVPTGPNEGHLVTEEELNILLDEYYAARGWDADGLPTAEKLKEVGLPEVAETLTGE